MSNLDSSTLNSIELAYRLKTNPEAVYTCPECGHFALELAPLKTHWTFSHTDELGDFPGPNTTELRSEP